ncbi:STAS domain-containing protein [Streptomyces sp. WAC06614]|uniref:STAS domain-containing protein n=1 Tax=Streptomyces sp. WAC06614 TaxID=2487416 RepID=UPI000F76D55B|nr:STAS domain-containing protein [Streptomyces sp. WAC06614]RSS78505.1 anti-sigma factor antagonist [Streptomyces sp. WAC06614]
MTVVPSPHDAFADRPSAQLLMIVEGLTPDRVTAVVVGEITEAAVDSLRPGLLTALRSSARGLDLDLSQVTFCDIAGLHLLLDLREAAGTMGRTLSVTALSGPVHRLVRATDCAVRLGAGRPGGRRPVTEAIRRALAAGVWSPGSDGCLRVRLDGSAATVTWPSARFAANDGRRPGDRLLHDAVTAALHRAGLRSVRHRSPAMTAPRPALVRPWPCPPRPGA